MSLAEISDVQLGRLLGQVRPPSGAAPDLADRIVARSLRIPQMRARLLPLPRRHGPRRRPAVWSALVVANVMAAAAAAASWDGQRFDFHRLADLPQRVAAAVQIGHHGQNHHSVPVRKHPHPAPQIASVNRHLTVPVSPARALPRPAAPSAIPARVKSQAALHLRGTAQGRFQRQVAAVKPFRSIRAAPSKAAELHGRSIRRPELVEKTESRVAAMQQHQTEGLRVEARPQEQAERSAALAEHQQSRAEAKAYENSQRTSEAMEGPEARQANLERSRERRWRSQLFKRMRPRERGGRFRRRF